MVSKEELIERVRLLLNPTIGAPLPDNELTHQVLTSIFTDQEIFIIAKGFRKSLRPTSIGKICKRTNIPKKELKPILNNMDEMGKLMKVGGPFYVIPSYLPGVFEMYFIACKDDPEKLKTAGDGHYKLLASGFHKEYLGNYNSLLRVIPAVEPTLKSIEVDKELSTQHRVLTYEKLRKYLAKQKVFAITECCCRNAAKYSGNPCKKATENFCVSAGVFAKFLLKRNLAKQITYEELIKLMDRAEKEGLVHQTTNLRRKSIYFCNCCSCCCAVLKTAKDLKDNTLVGVSNFTPVHDPNQCLLCETCVSKCPMGAITSPKLSAEHRIQFDSTLCIGCGVCSSNCPNGAITLKKTRNVRPTKSEIGIFRILRKKKKIMAN